MDGIFMVLAVVGIILAVVLVILMVKAAKVTPAILTRYEGVFSKRTVTGLFLSVYCAVGLGGFTIGAVVAGIYSVSEAFISFLVAVMCVIIAVFLVLRAKSKCPPELMLDLGKSLAITAFGVLGNLIRISWNITWGICSVIPGFGWTANFMITKDKELKQQMVDMGAQADAETAAHWKQENEEKKLREAEAAAARDAEAQEAIRKKVWKEQGRTDIEFNRDSTEWKYRDEDWSAGRKVYK